MSQIDDVRTGIHGMWATVTEGWEVHADENDVRAEPITRWMLEQTAPRAGERVLELACGPGGTGIAAAQRVGDGGEVVLSDVVAGMAEIAGRRAAALGLANVRTAVLDIEAIDEPVASTDVVLCREGLMFAVDPRQAAREIARVLRPGGRVAVAVWGPRPENPWLGIVLDSVGEHLGVTLPPPGTPGPFSLSDGDELAAVLRDGGLVDVRTDRVAVPYEGATVDRWWARTCACAGPLAQLLAGLPGEAAEAIRARAFAAVAGYTVDGRVQLPGVSLVASARVAP
jgi:enediyne biosynthesis protein CalE5